jgi:8-oxo-dGTP diphosphatase
MHVRNSLKAVIIQNNRILLTKNQDEDGVFYLFPGGGQHHGETFHEALTRECHEEIGAEIIINDLIFVREYIGKNHEHSEHDYSVHQVEYLFSCELKEPEQKEFIGFNPDEHQSGVEWVAISSIDKVRMYPDSIKKHLRNKANNHHTPIYLGDIN